MVKEVDSVLKVGKELADYIVELSYARARTITGMMVGSIEPDPNA